MSALREAFLDELKDLLDAELQLLKALPKMAEAAQNESLRVAFEEHRGQTADQIRRLGQVFEKFEETARGKKCKGMKGLVEEAADLIEKEEGDAALIAAAQKAEHYEIAAYGTLMSWAVALGHDEVLELLRETLEEEKAADKKLTVIAQTVVNAQDTLREAEEKETKPKRRQPKRRQTRARTQPTRRKTSTHARAATTRGRGARTMRSSASSAPRSKRLRASRK